MAVKIVTDSTADIPPGLAAQLGIAVVPIYVRFGDRVLRDGVDITPDQFYRLLEESPHHPASSQPTPEDFESTYAAFCDDAEGIISIHISSKISGTCNAAAIAAANLRPGCPIEVTDSGLNSAGLALVVMEAARQARAGKDFPAVLQATRTALRRTDMLGMFSTMKYLVRGGRVSRAVGTVAAIINVMPLLTFREGEIVRAGMVRSLSAGMDRLSRFVADKNDLAEVVIVHSAVPDRAEMLRERLGGLFPKEQIPVFEMGAGLGVHGGPGVLLVGTRERAPASP
jgi:DegV family protein with EDD domain